MSVPKSVCKGIVVGAVVSIVCWIAPSFLWGQCTPQWLPGMGIPDVNGDVAAMVSWDPDGAGPTREVLIVGGSFTIAGAVHASNIAAWNGTSWSALGAGLTYGSVSTLAVFDDDASGPNPPILYAGGSFMRTGDVVVNHVARWDGKSWSALEGGTNREVHALEVFNDGTGWALLAGGSFAIAGNVNANFIAKWDGKAWSSLGSGTNSTVTALKASNETLFVGGYFSMAGGGPASRIAQWNGQSWRRLGNGISAASQYTAVYALDVFDDGGGAALYAAGNFSDAGSENTTGIAKWNGTSWVSVGGGLDGTVEVLKVFNDGGRPALFAGGSFNYEGTATPKFIGKWDGASWSSVGNSTNRTVYSLGAFDDGNGPALYAGAARLRSSAYPNYILKWNGSLWSPLRIDIDSAVQVLKVCHENSAQVLYAGGSFTRIGGIAANRIAKWDGVEWSPLGDGLDRVPYDFEVFDDGGGPTLHVGGSFTTAGGVAANGIAKWTGNTWVPLDGGVGNTMKSMFGPAVVDLEVFDDGTGPALYAGGAFDTAGGIVANDVAKWDGASWSPLGDGLPDELWYAGTLEMFDDGNGPALFAGGYISDDSIDGLGGRVTRWDGTSWSSVFEGDPVIALKVFDDGTGPALYAGGGGYRETGASMGFIAKWDANSWTYLSGLSVSTFAVIDAGTGPELYAGGGHCDTHCQATHAFLSKWNGATWSHLIHQSFGGVGAIESFNDGSGPALYAGGNFIEIDGVISASLARWRCPCPHCDRDGDGRIDAFDFSAFVSCMAGPEIPYGNGCENARLDAGHDIDLADFAVFQNEFTGRESR